MVTEKLAWRFEDPGFFGFGGEREPVERHQAPIHGDVGSLLGFDQGVDSLDEVGDVEEIAAEGEVVGHDAEARRADGCAKWEQGGGGLGRGTGVEDGAAAGVVGVVSLLADSSELPLSLMLLNSTCERFATWFTWISSDEVSSLPGTALPSTTSCW